MNSPLPANRLSYKMSMLKKVLLCLVLASVSLLAATPEGGADAPDLARKTRKVVEYYENIVSESLRKFYDPRSYMVNAKVVLNEMIVPLEYNKVDKRLRGVERLPGLPVVPDALKGDSNSGISGDSMQVRRFRKEFGVRYVDINILVDTSYNVDDFEFIVEMTQMSADLDEYRGDRVNIRKKVFPRQNRGLDGSNKETWKKPTPTPVAAPVQIPATKPAVDNPWKPYFDNLPSLFPLLLLLLFVLLIVIIVVRALKPEEKKKERSPELEALLKKVEELKAPSTESTTAEDEDEQGLEYSKVRTFALNRFIGNPSESTNILQDWISANREKGLKDSAILIAGIDSSLLDLISPELNAKDVRAIDLHLRTGGTPSIESALPVFREFKKRAEESASAGSTGSDSDIFNFVRQLTVQQVVHLLKGESDGISGLVLAQLHPSQAAELVQKLEPERRAKILVSMGKIDNIPVKVYKEVASRLSRKALEVGGMKEVAANGLDSVLEVIDSLSIEEQAQYVNSISEMDLGLGEKIRKSFVAFEEISSLPEKFLQKVLPELEPEVISVALVNAPTEMVDKLMGFFPERMQMMIRSGIETGVNKLPAEIESARKQLLQSIRRELKISGGQL